MKTSEISFILGGGFVLLIGSIILISGGDDISLVNNISINTTVYNSSVINITQNTTIYINTTQNTSYNISNNFTISLTNNSVLCSGSDKLQSIGINSTGFLNYTCGTDLNSGGAADGNNNVTALIFYNSSTTILSLRQDNGIEINASFNNTDTNDWNLTYLYANLANMSYALGIYNNLSLKANLSQGYYLGSNQTYNDTVMIIAVNGTANTKSFPGTCGVGSVVQNTTTSGVQCVVDQTGTSSNSLIAGGSYLYNDSTKIYFNASNFYTGLFVNYTVNTTTGNITNGSLSGYAAANQKCNLIYAGSHMCTINEVLNTINRNMSNENFTATFRATMGAPGYLANANDCEGLTDANGASLGSIWVGSRNHNNTYGSGSLVACNAVRAIGCCR